MPLNALTIFIFAGIVGLILTIFAASKRSNLGSTGATIIGLLGAGLVIGSVFGGINSFSITETGATDVSGKTTEFSASTPSGLNRAWLDSCSVGGAGSTMSLTTGARNIENNTGQDNFDLTCNVYKVTGSGEAFVGQVTDWTPASQTATTYACGYEHVAKCVSASGDYGDNSRLTQVFSPIDANTRIDEQGFLHFAADAPTKRIEVGATRHAALEVNAFDVNGNNWMFTNTGLQSGNTFRGDAISWESATNDTNISIGLSGSADVYYLLRSTRPDVDFSDRGWCWAMDYSTTVLDEMDALINNKAIPNTEGELTADERRATGGVFDQIHCVGRDVPIKDGTAERARLDLNIQALSGVNPTSATTINHTILSRGAFTDQIDGISTTIGLANNAGSPVLVHEQFSFVQFLQ